MSDNTQDTGFQDLLFNGAIACVLLFIIIGINAVGKSFVSETLPKNKGEHSSVYSLPLKSPALKGKMKSVYIVEISLSNGRNILETEISNDRSPFKWESGFRENDITTSVYLENNKLVNSAIIGEKEGSAVVFKSQSGLPNMLGQVTLKIIEGLPVMEENDYWRTFNGLLQVTLDQVSIENLSVEFSYTSDPRRVFKINDKFVPITSL